MIHNNSQKISFFKIPIQAMDQIILLRNRAKLEYYVTDLVLILRKPESITHGCFSRGRGNCNINAG